MKRKPSEFAVNSFASMISVLQSDDLDLITSQKFFNEHNPCHIYMICRRPRIIIEPNKFKCNNDSFDMYFKIQKKEKFEEFYLKINNPRKPELVEIESYYPFNSFKLKSKDDTLSAKTATFLQTLPRYEFNGDFLDLEILYIGQSYGVEGARTAPDRLKKHETLQAIYAEALNKNPDQEIWLILLSFQQLGITMLNGRTPFTEQEIEEDKSRLVDFFKTMSGGGITEQQFINFTEAALIQYFKPSYNKEYKDTFPNPAHKTYLECYDLDINSVCLELGTMESVNVMVYSEFVERNPIHMADFLLHNKRDRMSMFDFSNFF
jgi:hypothetical protein